MYGYSKQMFDLWVKQNNLLDKFAGLKFFNIFGPNEYHKNDMRSMVVKAYEQIKSTGRVKLFKSDNPDYEHGKQMRDFFYVKHTAKLVYEFVKNKELNGIFNIGSGKASTWIELVSPIFEALNLPVNIDFVDMPDNLKNKYQYFTEADMNKLYSVIPAVEFNLSSAVKDYVLNYLEKDCYL
jgi:ADP-L-glycero-D-manno-heptose 6-epimerase